MTRRLLAGALALLLAAACAPSRRGAEQRLRFWALGREGEVVRELMPEFTRRHPGVTVDVQQIPWTAAHEKLLTAIVGRQTPDVAQIGNTWVPEFVALRAIAALDERIARSRSVVPGDVFAGVWDTNVLDGRVYGIPWYVDTRLLFYRKDLLEAAGVTEPPRTWAAWREAMAKVRAKGPAERYGILLPTNEFSQVIALGLQTGSPLLADGGRRGAFREPAFRKAAAFYADLYTSGLAPPLSNSQVSNVYQQFAAGDYAMYITGPWNLGEFRRRLPVALQGSWATAPLPAPDEASGYPGASLAGGSSLVVFAGSERMDAAWALVEFLAEPSTQARFYTLTGDLPARRSAWEDPSLAHDTAAAAFRVQLERVVATPKVPEWEEIAQKVWERLEPVVRGRQPLDDALAALDRDVDVILEKRRWLLDRAAAGGPR